MTTADHRADRPAVDPRHAAPPARGRRLLPGLNPLAKIAGTAPAMVALVFVRDLATPLAFIALAYLLLLVGAPLTRRMLLLLLLVVPGAVAVAGLAFSLWADAARVDQTPVVLQAGGWMLYAGALETGFATALRLGAIASLALIGGLTTAGADLARSLVQQLHVPYRVGYTALAALRFVPRFAYELDLIRQAHRVRGVRGGRGPFGVVARWFGYVVPLLAGAIRHAERVALAMDSRGFGAHPTRTERHLVPFRARDVIFVVALWAASIALLLLL